MRIALGYVHLDTDELVATRIHKVTPEYIRAMRYPNLKLDELVASRIHKATPEFTDKMKRSDTGKCCLTISSRSASIGLLPNSSATSATSVTRTCRPSASCQMRIHRVTPEFIRELKDARSERIPIEKLIEMRIHGIDANFVRKMNGSK